MKRRLFILILCAALCMTVSTFADVELTFEQVCKHKTTAQTQVYTVGEDGKTLNSGPVLPAGTYIIPNGQTVEGRSDLAGVTYYRFENYGFIDSSVITSAVVSVPLSNGESVTVGEALANSTTALNHWINMEYDTTVAGTTYTDANGISHEIGNDPAAGEGDLEDRLAGEAKYQTAMGRATKNNGGYALTVYKDDKGNETEVQVLYMGLARSKVRMEGKEQMVDTWRLSWETEAPEDKVLAVITPKDAKNVRMRATHNEKSTVLDRVDTARVVQVLKTDKSWTLVDTNDELLPCGYIQTAVLTFYPNEKKEYQSAVITVKGSTKANGNLVKIRAKGDRNGRIIGEFTPGEPLTVLQNEETGNWMEVDVGGYHAFIQSEYVTYRRDAFAVPQTP